MFLIGFIALMGIIVNNAIILIDSANENMSRGYSRSESIKEKVRNQGSNPFWALPWQP